MTTDMARQEPLSVSVVVRHVIWHLDSIELRLGYKKKSQVHNQVFLLSLHPGIKERTALSPDADYQLSTRWQMPV